MILDEILETKRAEVRRLAESRARFGELVSAGPPPRGFEAAIGAGEAVHVIAEFKRRSPSAGAIDPYAAPERVVPAYERGGAAAVSVLTDERFFGGSLRDLMAAREACALPLLRKDFVIDPLQVMESRAAGADAILLIVRALEGERLEELLEACDDLRMSALVEVHDVPELDRALEAGARLVGVNARDLGTFDVDFEAALELVARVPGDRVAVAESGVSGPEDVERAGRVGADAVLVGGWLMRQDPARRVAGLVGHRSRPRRTE